MCHLLVDLPSIEPILSIEENYYETKYFEHVDIRKRLIESISLSAWVVT